MNFLRSQYLPLIFGPCIALALSLALTSCTQSTPERIDNWPFEVHNLFTDHVVLQCNSEVPIWGWNSTGVPVTVKTSWGETLETFASKDHQWKAILHTPKAGGPHEITIETPDCYHLIQDVLLGEVWLAAGQSNMQMPLFGFSETDTVANWKAEVEKANYPGIRMFVVRDDFSSHPERNVSGRWQVVTPEEAPRLSAVPYFFAGVLHNRLHVPIGVIISTVGSTGVEAWTSREMLIANGQCLPLLQTLSKAAPRDTMRKWFARWKSYPLPPEDSDWDSLYMGELDVASPEYYDAGWATVHLPGLYDTGCLGSFDGAVWLRRDFHLQDTLGDLELVIGAIDDMEQIFLNGTRVGGVTRMGQHERQRNVRLPSTLLRRGRNLIAIRASDPKGLGAVRGVILLRHGGKEIQSLRGEWKIQWAAEFRSGKAYIYNPREDLSQRRTIADVQFNHPSVPFNVMIHPLIPYGIKGVIWYQGESNLDNPVEYKDRFTDMVMDWRNRWGRDFPFYYAQIAPFPYTQKDYMQNASMLRQSQLLSSRQITNSGMAVTLDLGSSESIHSPRKREVGERLARLALAYQYGVETVATGPLFSKSRIENGRIFLSFDHTGSGLVASEGGLRDFEIAGEDKVFIPAKATIVGEEVEVYSATVLNPKFVRYAWRDMCVGSLFNREGLPASSFSTEYE